MMVRGGRCKVRPARYQVQGVRNLHTGTFRVCNGTTNEIRVISPYGPDTLHLTPNT